MPDIGPLPASGNGHITFGSFNNFNKLSATCIELWARILCAVPGSRLLMVTVPEGQARSALIDRFASLGVAADRLTLHGKLPSVDFYALFRKTDIAFDPFPMTGGTTTCETLWMAVPVIVRVGDRYRSRLGLSFLTAAGYPEFAVTSNDAYFELAVRLASDIPALADLHAGMRARIAASPLIDAARFARNLESLYRQMWHDWCCSVT
jgi:predicted O-linked N-acetylglucosamine transferase (SPINDLY family)